MNDKLPTREEYRKKKNNDLEIGNCSLEKKDTKEEDFAHKRQLFLTEQGYHYELLDKDSFEELEFEN